MNLSTSVPLSFVDPDEDLLAEFSLLLAFDDLLLLWRVTSFAWIHPDRPIVREEQVDGRGWKKLEWRGREEVESGQEEEATLDGDCSSCPQREKECCEENPGVSI